MGVPGASGLPEEVADHELMTSRNRILCFATDRAEVPTLPRRRQVLIPLFVMVQMRASY